MPKINLSTADLEVQDANALFCRSCSATADEGKNYCIHCESYWADCDAGLWDNPEPIS